ncbi:glycine--tRNA ligase subunit beta [Allofustis seminis]|uniref:glycine--tRNA ligase subunit beta n=1 Tax=Allofustis seminis TaxID=166939 RepID=UPI00037202CE|nr:glycine--tRNA ligase subunit beta [Allofustis seminis]
MTHTLLLEVGLEEMPANAIVSAEQQLAQKVADFLTKERIHFSKVESFSTPRRFAVKVFDVSDQQEDVKTIVRGPARQIAQDAEGNWTKAAIGFATGQGASVEDIIFKEETGKEYTYIEKFIQGKPSLEILKDLREVVPAIEFKKNMKWSTTSYQYVRPIHWLVALFDDQIIPFEVFDIPTCNKSRGHRFLSPDSFEINHAKDYEQLLMEHKVNACRNERKEAIVQQIEALVEENNWIDPTHHTSLLEEVTDLTEWPTVFVGQFDPAFLEVFDVILETSMMNHQRYFPVRSADTNELLPYFIGVRNGDDRNIEGVAQGNEKVIAARLADARFFYKEDQKITYKEWNDKLKQLAFHDRLGTIYDKELRVQQIVKILSQKFHLSPEDEMHLVHAAEIYKTDLVSEVVNEFTELQGVIGGHYAYERGEDPKVAEAIGQHYLPISTDGALPDTLLGSLLSVADKLDTLLQFFSAGMIPTGSNDPFALRRQAMGVVRIAVNLDQTFSLVDWLDEIVEKVSLTEEIVRGYDKHRNDLIAFLDDRLAQYIKEHHQLPYDIIQAARGGKTSDIVEKVNIAIQIDKRRKMSEFKSQIQSVKRVLNITKTQEQQFDVDVNFFETDSEKDLHQAILSLKEQWNNNMKDGKHIDLILSLSPQIDNFFEENMVMVEDTLLRNNRIALLQYFAKYAQEVADFNELVI